MAQATSHLRMLDASLEESYDWIDRICTELEDDDRHFAMQVLRGVLHALRDHLTIEQSAHLSAQFPTLIRGLYFEEWTPDAPHPGRSAREFLARIEGYLKGYEGRCDVEEAARAVFAVLEENLSGGADKIKATLPKPVRELWI